MRVAVVGAGFSGIAVAAALLADGSAEVTVYERAAGPGGVWRDNTYPGAACDVPSYLYSYSFAQRTDWGRPCSPQPEILQYLTETADRLAVTERIRTGVAVVSARFDETALDWQLQAAGGEVFRADVVVLACGQLARPSWPQIPGMDRFAGTAFHSAQWQHGDLHGKRVAVIGTGASAVQFVPRLADVATQLDVYQRSAPWLLPRRNRAYSPLVRSVLRKVPRLQTLRRQGMVLFMESAIYGLTTVPPLRWLLALCSRAFMRWQVRDPELRRRTRPDYPFGCKRVLFSSSYLPALGRRSVSLITDPVARITADAVVTADGTSRPADVLVYGTGFRAGDFVAPLRVTGTGGRDLQEAWRDGAHAHLGLAVSGFPNLFLMYGPNTNLGIGSILVMIEAQARYVRSVVRLLLRTPGVALEVRPEVAAAFDAATQRRLRRSVWNRCDSWYRRANGRLTNNWPGTMREYAAATREFDRAHYRQVRATGVAG